MGEVLAGYGVLYDLKLARQGRRGHPLGWRALRLSTMTVDPSLVFLACLVGGAIVLAYYLGIEVGKDGRR